MSESSQLSSRWTLAMAAAAFAVGLLIGRAVGLPAAESAGSAPAVESVAAESVVERHQIPVTKSQPSQGPKDAIVTLVHWCDFHSPGCRGVEPILREVLPRYGEQVRLVFRHFSDPSDGWQPAHELARVAHEQAGRFWEFRELLLRGEGGAPTLEALERYAVQVGLDWPAARSALERHTYGGHVVADRMFAEMFEVRAVPALFVNGRRLDGAATRDGLAHLIEDELARANKLVAQGVPKERVYAELTKNGAWQRPSARPN